MSRILPALVVLSVVLVGCGFLEKAGEVATTPNAVGVAPLDEVIGAVPRVATNPLDIGGWLTLVGGLATIILGGLGYAVKTSVSTNKKVNELEIARKIAEAKTP